MKGVSPSIHRWTIPLLHDKTAPMTEPAPPRRWPIFPTLLVAAAIATMIALGVWQMSRAAEKDALLALFARNAALSSTIALPQSGPIPPEALFSRSSGNCLEVIGWRQLGGRTADGTTGYRHIAECKTGAEGPGFVADMGLAEDPQFVPAWRGGPVEGVITEEPVEGGLWASLTGARPVPRPMIVATNPPTGLRASTPPDPSSVPNNHIAYAVQWFLFAVAAAVIYVLALRQRWKKATVGATPK
jgi:surfeit locus 1 family protein